MTFEWYQIKIICFFQSIFCSCWILPLALNIPIFMTLMRLSVLIFPFTFMWSFNLMLYSHFSISSAIIAPFSLSLCTLICHYSLPCARSWGRSTRFPLQCIFPTTIVFLAECFGYRWFLPLSYYQENCSFILLSSNPFWTFSIFPQLWSIPFLISEVLWRVLFLKAWEYWWSDQGLKSVIHNLWLDFQLDFDQK